jgi:hypothetical protein
MNIAIAVTTVVLELDLRVVQIVSAKDPRIYVVLAALNAGQ